MVLVNCTVASTRGGVPVYARRGVQIDTVPLGRAPSLPGTDNLTEIGALNIGKLYDTLTGAGGDWQPGDQVTVLSRRGISSQRSVMRYGVYSSAEMGGLLPHIVALLVAIPSFSRIVTVNRGDYDNVTGRTGAPEVVGTISCYLDDVSNDFSLQGIAPEFVLRLVTDGASDIQQGDRLTGVPLATGQRTPTLLVQHVGIHTLAGWTYKVARVNVVQ